MREPAIVDVPFWFEAKLLRVRCRNREDALLRSTVPYAMPHLSKTDVTPALSVSIDYHQAPHRRRAPFRLTWLFDGAGYLRPLRVHPAGAGGDHAQRDYEGSGEPMTLEAFRDILAFRPEMDFNRWEFPARWLFADNPKLRHAKFKGRNVDKVDPAAVETPEALVPVIKEWISTNQELVAAEALRDAVRYVLLDGIVHRRVPLPVWGWTHAAQILVDENLPGTDPVAMWPMHLTDHFGASIASIPPERRNIADAEAEILRPFDEKADLARVGSLLLDRLWQYAIMAAPHLSDENIDRYKRIRASREVARGDLPVCTEALAALETTLSDPGWKLAKKYPNSSEDNRPKVAGHLAHWRRLLHAGGHPILDARDEEALAALA